MNQIRQEEVLKDMRRAGAISENDLLAAMAGPVFVYDVRDPSSLSALERDYIVDNVLSGSNDYSIKCPPFDAFRIIPRHPAFDRTWIQVFTVRSPVRFAIHQIACSRSLFLVERIENDGGRPVGESRCYVDGKLFPTAGLRFDFTDRAATLKDVMLQNWFVIVSLCFDLATRSCVSIRVTPKVNGSPRSVEWIRARTHYLVLHRTEAQACAKSGRAPGAHEIKRSAHWRRAHLRRLMSEHWANKRGQVVPVRQAWVGPKEWEGADGKVYLVQD